MITKEMTPDEKRRIRLDSISARQLILIEDKLEMINKVFINEVKRLDRKYNKTTKGANDE
jgi:hypothetical protein